MTDRAQPGAIDSLIRNDELAQVFGRFSEGFIVPGNNPTPAAQRRGDIDETALDAFSLTTSATSLDVTVAPGEAFVSGWVCRDVSTTLTLPANSTVDIVVGFDPDAIFDPTVDADRDAADETVVDLAGNVDKTTPTTVAHRVSTDGSGVTSSERIATVGGSISVNTLEADSITDGADVTHSGELADSSDVSPIQSSSDVTVTDTQTGTVSDQEFLKNEGGNLTGTTVQTEPNLPDFVEDSGSPFTASNTQNFTISLDERYDDLIINIAAENEFSAEMRIKFDSSTSYRINNEDGSRTSANHITLRAFPNNGDVTRARLRCLTNKSGADTEIIGTVLDTRDSTGVRFKETGSTNITPDNFSLETGNTNNNIVRATVEVFGRDFG